MTRRAWRTGRKAKWTLATLALLFGVVLLLNVFVTRWARAERAASDTALKSTVAAMDQRKAEQQAAIERAKAALPPDAGIHSDWSYDACVKQIDNEKVGLLLLDNEATALAIFGGADLPPGTEGSSPANSVARSRLADIRDRVACAREAGTATPGYDRIDLSKHSREEILSSVESYIAGLRPLQETEEAYVRGIFSVSRLGSNERVERTLKLYRMLPDALACRAILEVRRGDIEKAVNSCSIACGMYRRVFEAQGEPLVTAERWYVGLLAYMAWKASPLTHEQRERLISSFAPRVAPERIPEVMMGQVAEDHQSVREIGDGLRRRCFPRFLADPMISIVETSFQAQIDFCARRLYPRLIESSRLTATEIDQTLATPLSLPGPFTAPAHWLASDLADYTVKAALGNCMPDVLRTFFALKDYQRAHGEYPKTLDGLCPDPIPALPDDPVNGGPMIYESDGKTLTISLRPMALPPDASDFVKEHVKWVNEHPVMWRANG